MEIVLTAGVGNGPTALAAFDGALQDAGIANYNLIPLSSVIPIGARIVERRPEHRPDHYGWRLYVVLSVAHTEHSGAAYAGLGWMQTKDGRGLLVEHHGGSAEEVHQRITSSLTHMRKGRAYQYGDSAEKIIGTTADRMPSCAVVAAVFQAQNWAYAHR